MALSGTLKDFGIADIFQLIGNQQKSGQLVLQNETDRVDIIFFDGNVIAASEKNRKTNRFLGAMLVRADLVKAEKLEEALVQQKRSLKRLGDILIEMGAISEGHLSEMARLQTSETVYRLFDWKSGTYEFTQRDVDPGNKSFDPIRAETILLEGFRRTDEWPSVQRALPSLDATVRRLKPVAPNSRDDDSSDPMAMVASRPGARHDTIYNLAAEPDRTLQKIADLSRMGDFEAFKVIRDLVANGNFALVAPARGRRAAMKELAAGGRAFARSGWLFRLVLGLACFFGTMAGLRKLLTEPEGIVARKAMRRSAGAHLIARDQLLRLESALEVYRLEHGEYPAALHALVEAQLIGERELMYPYDRPYPYRRSGNGFVLLPPLD
jgi:hypothetical protein